jgi:hypothetical protein
MAVYVTIEVLANKWLAKEALCEDLETFNEHK